MPRIYQGPLRKGERSAYVPGTRKNKTYSKSAYKKEVPATTKEVANKNAKKIYTLESKSNGHVQRGYHRCKLLNSPGLPAAWNFQPDKPILFALNDFYTSTTAPGGGPGSIYYPLYSGASPNITMSGAIVSRWADYLPGQSLGHAEQYQQWKDQQLSQPSKVGYQPIYTDVKLNILRRNATPAQGTLWVRIDMFHAKRIYQASTGGSDPKIYNMPAAVGALSNMASDGFIRNSFNPGLWKTKTRWIKLPAVEQDQKYLTKTVHIRCAFPKKFLALNMDTDTTGVGEAFWQMCDPRDVKWCLISLSDNSVNQTTDPSPELSMTRKVVYRDSRGHQM